MGNWLAELLIAQGVSVQKIDIGTQVGHYSKMLSCLDACHKKMPTQDGEVEVPLPPVLFGELGNDPTKKTLLLCMLIPVYLCVAQFAQMAITTSNRLPSATHLWRHVTSSNIM